METIERSLVIPAGPEHSELQAAASLLTRQEQIEVSNARVHSSGSTQGFAAAARPFQLTHAEVVLIEQFEGWDRVVPGSNPRVVEQYLDGAGVPTIGFGTTSADISPLPHRMTFAESENLLIRKLHSPYGTAVARLNLPNPNMQAACLSLAYNCGPGILGSGFSIGRALMARDYKAAGNLFMLYVHDINGNVEPGLVTRRRTEQALFRKPWTEPDPHHYLWFDNTPHVLFGKHLIERNVVKQYDKYRAQQTKTKHPHRIQLVALRLALGWLVGRVTRNANKQRNWTVDHRRWRVDQMNRRRHGQSVV